MKPFTPMLVAFFGLPIITLAAEITGPCPSGQQQIAGSKCCPGPAMGGDGGKTYCCVTGECSVTNCAFSGSCKAKVASDDPDYDSKVKAAMEGSTASPTAGASSTSASGSASTTGADETSGSPSATDTASTPESTGAAGTNNAMLGLVAGVAAFAAVA